MIDIINLDSQDIKIIKTLADCNLKIATCAKKLNYHRNTVVYHANAIKQATGLNPFNFYDMCRLLNWLELLKVDKSGKVIFYEYSQIE